MNCGGFAFVVSVEQGIVHVALTLINGIFPIGRDGSPDSLALYPRRRSESDAPGTRSGVSRGPTTPFSNLPSLSENKEK